MSDHAVSAIEDIDWQAALGRIMGRARALPNGGRRLALMGGSYLAKISPLQQYQLVWKKPGGN